MKYRRIRRSGRYSCAETGDAAGRQAGGGCKNDSEHNNSTKMTRGRASGAKMKHQPKCNANVNVDVNAERTATPARGGRRKHICTCTKKSWTTFECPARQIKRRDYPNERKKTSARRGLFKPSRRIRKQKKTYVRNYLHSIDMQSRKRRPRRIATRVRRVRRRR